MSHRSLRLAAACMALLASAAYAAEALPGLENFPEIAAEVNGRKISTLEVLREVIGSSGNEALDRLVRRKLVEQAAKAAGITVSDDDIDKEFALDKRDLMEELIRTPWDWRGTGQFPIEEIIKSRFRMTVEEYKKYVIRQKLLIQRCVARDFAPTEAQLRETFELNKDYFQPPVRYHASHILVTPIDPNDAFRGLAYQGALSQKMKIKQERQRIIDMDRNQKIKFDDAPPIEDLDPLWRAKRDAAEKIMKDIQSKVITWEQAVRKYTQDPHDQKRYDRKTKRQLPSLRESLKPPLEPGDVGWFHEKGPLVKEFYEAAKNLKPGEMCGPIRTEYGYHIIRMTEIQKPAELPFDQLRDQVYRELLARYLCGQQAVQGVKDMHIPDRTTTWVNTLADTATLETNPTLLWPPLNTASAGPSLDPLKAPSDDKVDKDPVFGTVNGEPLKRSEVWRELMASEGDDAVVRILNLEVVMSMLKTMGLERMEWECSNPEKRSHQPPEPKPVTVASDDVDRELTEDRLRCEQENEIIKSKNGALAAKDPQAKPLPEVSFKDYIYQHYGQSEKDFKRSVEANLILISAIRARTPVDEGTLRVQFTLTREAYDEPAWYEISHILFTPEGGMEKADSNALLKAIHEAQDVKNIYAQAPDTWNQLVTNFSKDEETKARGGLLPKCYYNVRDIEPGTGQTRKFFEGPTLFKAIQAQNLQPQPGMASTPIRTSRGFHVVKVDKVHPARKAEFEEVRRQIENDFIKERAKMYTDVWVRALYRQSKVKNFLTGQVKDAEQDLPPDNFWDQMPRGE